MAGHGGARQAQFHGQVLLGDEGIGADQLVELVLLGGIGHGLLAKTFVHHGKHLFKSSQSRTAAKFGFIYNTPDLYRFSINAEEKWYLPYIWTMMHSVSFPSHNRKTEDNHV
ncbi:hypothetical protein RugamoR64_10980 [Duganella rhizosphaerae]